MSEINTVNLLNQIREMTAQAEGSKLGSLPSNDPPFTAFLQQALGKVNDLTQTADGLKTQFEMGDPNVSLGDVMIANQKERLGSYATLTVRNKLVQAYQEVMNMSV